MVRTRQDSDETGPKNITVALCPPAGSSTITPTDSTGQCQHRQGDDQTETTKPR